MTDTAHLARVAQATASQIAAARERAIAAFNAAMGLPNAPAATIRKVWQTFQIQFRAAGADHLAVASAAERTLRAFTELDAQHLDAITELDVKPASSGYLPHYRPNADRAWASHPVLAAYHAAEMAEADHRAAVQAAATKAAQEQAERDAPRTMLASLRARGFYFGLSDDGKHVTLPPGQAAALLPSDGAGIKQHRAAIIALLKAEVDAARPVVVA